MIDFVLAAALTILSVAAVRRLRTRGFDGLRPPAALFSTQRREIAADEALPTTPQAARFEAGPRLVRRRILGGLTLPGSLLPAEPPPPAAFKRPGAYLAAWLAGIVLLVIAVVLQRELWFMRGDLTPLWTLLVVGAIFGVVVHLGLQLPESLHPRPVASGVSRTDLTGGAIVGRGTVGADPGEAADADASRTLGALGLAKSLVTVPGGQLIATAFAMELLALAVWAGTTSSNLAWILHLAAGPAFLLGVWRVTRARLEPLLGTWSSVDTAAVVILCVLGLIPRVWQLSTVPEGIWFDEGLRGIEAFKIAADPNYRPVFVSQILQEPTAFWYLMIPFLETMGRDPAALRLPSAIAGALSVGAVYLLARVLFERRTALIAAGLTVGMTWHLNYSRVAFLAMWSVMLDGFAAALFVLALRRRSTFLYAAAGLTAGIAIHFYYSSRLLPPILAVVVLYHLVAERGRFIRGHAVGLVTCALGFVLAAAPIGEYALLHPQEFSARTATVSVFKEVEQAKSWDPLINSAKAHLLMFNFHGDNNGRHNWTGRPMLDSVIGALFILGLGIAITSLRHWSYAMVLAWVPIMLLGGTLSLSWEAPQSHRSVEEVTAVAILAALPLALLWRAADALPSAFSALAMRMRRLAIATSPSGEAALPFGGSAPMAIWAPSGGTAVAEPRLATPAPSAPPVPGTTQGSVLATFVARWFGAIVMGLVVVTGILNVQRYFGPQQHDNRTWQEFSTPPTIAGRLINDVPVDWKIYVDPVFMGNPSMHFMIRGDRQLVPYDPAAMPIAEPAAMVFLSNREQASAARVAQFYPTAQRQLFMQPEGDDVGLYAFTLAPEDVQESQGVMATYRVGDSPTRRREARLEFDWTTSSPVPAPFDATVETTLAAPSYGTYRFRLQGPPSSLLILDGEPVTTAGGDGEVVLARGVHALRLEVRDAGGEPVRVLWAPPNSDFESIPVTLLHVPPVRATGLLARLYRGTEPSGDPAIAKVDPAVELKVHQLPLPRPYTIEWQGAVRAHRDGTYRFGTTSIDASAVWIDGQQIVDNRRPNTYVDGAVNLTAGWHDIRVRFLDATSFTHVTLYWEPPEGGRTVVPTDALRPWPADRVMFAQPEDMDLNRREPPALAGGPRPAAPAGVRMLASPSELVQPRGVALAPDGTVYIADAGRPGVLVVSPDGEPRQLAEGAFREPVAVAILADRTIAVLDAGAAAVWRMQPDGTGIERILPDVQLYGPRGITAAADGTIAIADTGNNRVILAKLNGPISMVGNLKEPTDVAFLPDGNLLVADTGSKNLRVVKRSGESVSSWSMPLAYTVVGPHVATLPGGGWVATSPETKSLLRFPPNGRGPDTWDLGVAWQKPVGIAAGRAGVVIADTDAAAVVMVGPP